MSDCSLNLEWDIWECLWLESLVWNKTKGWWVCHSLDLRGHTEGGVGVTVSAMIFNLCIGWILCCACYAWLPLLALQYDFVSAPPLIPHWLIVVLWLMYPSSLPHQPISMNWYCLPNSAIWAAFLQMWRLDVCIVSIVICGCTKQSCLNRRHSTHRCSKRRCSERAEVFGAETFLAEKFWSGHVVIRGVPSGGVQSGGVGQ